MILGIDTHNLRSGGGKNYIIELLNSSKPDNIFFEKIHIWGSEKLLNKINDKSYIIKHNERYLNSNYPNNIFSYILRIYWHIFLLKNDAKHNKCDLVFFPGSYNLSGVKNYVCINLNILPFEKNLFNKIGFSTRYIKFKLLKYLYLFSYKKSLGLIFLSNLSKKLINDEHKLNIKKFSIVPLGLKKQFFKTNQFSNFKTNNYKIIYISPFDFYKHQKNVFLAIKKLSIKYNIKLYFIGDGKNKYANSFKSLKIKNDPQDSFSKILNNLSEDELISFYHNSDIKIFASETEALPTIILEAMGSRMPIACSNVEPMKSILKNAAIFFNPNKIQSIVNAVEKLIIDEELRNTLSNRAFNLAKNFNWYDISKETLEFLYLSIKNKS